MANNQSPADPGGQHVETSAEPAPIPLTPLQTGTRGAAPSMAEPSLTPAERLHRVFGQMAERMAAVESAAECLPEHVRPSAAADYTAALRDRMAVIALNYVLSGAVASSDESAPGAGPDPDPLTTAARKRGFVVGEAPPAAPATPIDPDETAGPLGLAENAAYRAAREAGFDPDADADD